MVNLKAQYERFKPDIDAAIKQVCSEASYIRGLQVRQFEEELSNFLGVKHVVGVANGTDALQIALMCLELQRGDEVIVPSFAYAALPEVVLLLGLKPVFVDVEEGTYLMNLDDVERKITENTRVIAPVHLFGQSVNMDRLCKIAERYNLFILEDAAQSLGSFYEGSSVKGYTGTLGDIGTTSFFPSKNLGCFGDGGAMLIQDDGLAEKARIISNHGQVQKYYHDRLGVNSRLDTIQAAILSVKLPHLKEFNLTRKKRAEKYQEALKSLSGVETPYMGSSQGDHIFHQYTIKVKNGKRDDLVQYLIQQGIPSMIYYPLPLHKQKAYACLDNLAVSESLSTEVLSLPICPELTNLEQEKIINTLISFFNI
jgi:dTDP-4-amino-4,6-dideoxygalactose transaminase